MTELEIPEDIYQNVKAENTERRLLDVKIFTRKRQWSQQTGSVSVKSRKQRAVELYLLCALLLTAVIVLSVHFNIQKKHLQTHITNLTEERDQILKRNNNLNEERDQILKRNNNLTEERVQLLTNITNLTEEREQILKRNNILTEERVQLLTNITNLTKERDQLRNNTWPYEQDLPADNFTWICYNHTFYYISSEKKSWNDSRRDCQQRGADLVIIKSREEQNLLQNVVDKYFWTGLTNPGGMWKWSNRTVYTNATWTNNSSCTAVAAGGYYNFTCDSNNGWICEKTYHY